LPLISTRDLMETNDLIMAATILIYLSQGFVFYKTDHISQSIPKQLAIPLHDVCSKLDVKSSMGFVQNLYCWKKIDENISSKSLSNVALRFSFTGTESEAIFFLLSVVADTYMGDVFKAIFEANKSIEQGDEDEFLKNLRQIDESWKAINDEMHTMHFKNDPFIFYGKLRPFLAGFQDKSKFPDGILYEGVFTSTGKELRVSSEGGSVGNDPSFQMFERGMGIKFDGDIDTVQEYYATGFIGPHKKMVQFIEENTQLRSYVLQRQSEIMIQLYNSIIDRYILFNKYHWGYIEKYIIKQSHKKIEELKGVGNIPLMMVKKKFESLASFKIEK